MQGKVAHHESIGLHPKKEGGNKNDGVYNDYIFYNRGKRYATTGTKQTHIPDI